MGISSYGVVFYGVVLSVPRAEPKNISNACKCVRHPSHSELIAEAQQALAAAKRLVDEQTRRLEQTGSCNSEAIDLLNNLRELLTARQRRLVRVLSWPPRDNA